VLVVCGRVVKIIQLLALLRLPYGVAVRTEETNSPRTCLECFAESFFSPIIFLFFFCWFGVNGLLL
jgi:hypothetical protein